jgi:DNA repair exonuclease SbcCD ATPase subunit
MTEEAICVRLEQ